MPRTNIFFTAFITFFLIISPLCPQGYPSADSNQPPKKDKAIVLLKKPLSKAEIEGLARSTPNLQINFIYEHIFPGLSVNGPKEALKKLEEHATVLRVFPASAYRLEINQRTDFQSELFGFSQSLRQNDSPELSGYQWGQGSAGKNVINERIFQTKNRIIGKSGAKHKPSANHQTGFKSRPADHAANESGFEYKYPTSIQFIGTEKIRHKTDPFGSKLTGKGIKVGIIDTGIDYTHPDLQRAYAGGYDFIDGDHDPMETMFNGLQNTFHGTHVAGIIAANGKMTGMAPEAKLFVYRALGPGGFGSAEHILAAIDRAIKDEVDILNLSLGIQINGPDLPISLALDTAVRKGIIAVTSNGNAGPDIWTVGAPGTSNKAISVGASSPIMDIPYLDIQGEKIRLKMLKNFSQWDVNRSYPVVIAEELDIKTPDFSGKIAVLQNNKQALPLAEQIHKVNSSGAKAVLLSGFNEEDLLQEDFSQLPLPVALLPNEEPDALNRLLQANTLARIITRKEEDLLAPFSSRGPVTANWNIKPDLTAPGVAISSTAPQGYLTLNGTSMAAPHVAGACALLKQARPDLTPDEIKAILMNTSKPLITGAKFYQPFEQGAGRIQVEEALKTNSIIQPAALIFGKTKGKTFEEKTRTLVIENITDQPVRYTFPLPKRSEEIQWDLPLPFYLKPKEKKEVTVKLQLKKNHERKKLYSGYIEVSAGQQTIYLPYLYVVGEPDYPRIMHFFMEEGKNGQTIECEVYLPGGADEFGVALFDPDRLHFIEIIKNEKNVRRGLIKKEIVLNNKIQPGSYLAVAFAKKAGQENYLEQYIEIE